MDCLVTIIYIYKYAMLIKSQTYIKYNYLEYNEIYVSTNNVQCLMNLYILSTSDTLDLYRSYITCKACLSH